MSDAADALIAAVRTAITAPFGAVIRLEPHGLTPLWIDGRVDPVRIDAVAPSGADAACVWAGAADALARAIADERAFANAFLSGRLVISGDMSVMARLRFAAGGTDG